LCFRPHTALAVLQSAVLGAKDWVLVLKIHVSDAFGHAVPLFVVAGVLLLHVQTWNGTSPASVLVRRLTHWGLLRRRLRTWLCSLVCHAVRHMMHSVAPTKLSACQRWRCNSLLCISSCPYIPRVHKALPDSARTGTCEQGSPLPPPTAFACATPHDGVQHAAHPEGNAQRDRPWPSTF
jgi:hypothetical protein